LSYHNQPLVGATQLGVASIPIDTGAVMIPFRHSLIFLATLGVLTACDNSADREDQAQTAPATSESQAELAESVEANADPVPAPPEANQADPEDADASAPFSVTELTRFDDPWAMTFLPDGRLLVTEMGGALHIYDAR